MFPCSEQTTAAKFTFSKVTHGDLWCRHAGHSSPSAQHPCELMNFLGLKILLQHQSEIYWCHLTIKLLVTRSKWLNGWCWSAPTVCCGSCCVTNRSMSLKTVSKTRLSVSFPRKISKTFWRRVRALSNEKDFSGFTPCGLRRLESCSRPPHTSELGYLLFFLQKPHNVRKHRKVVLFVES